MPNTWNGIGTVFHGHSAPVRWERGGFLSRKNADHDAMECVTILFLPVFPLKAYHTYNWAHNSCTAMQIRSTAHLVVRAMLRPYLLGITWIGGIVASLVLLIQVAESLGPAGSQHQHAVGALYLCGIPFVVGLLGLIALNAVDRRYRDIRLLLGPHEMGSSDPATWLPETRAQKRIPASLCVETSLVNAGERALAEGRFAEAMLAARLAAGDGDLSGEELTENILRDLRVIQVLEALRRNPLKRAELLASKALGSLDPRVAEEGETPRCYACGLSVPSGAIVRFYDGHDYCPACLDNAGGAGLADKVRNEPVLTRHAPDVMWARVFYVIVFFLLIVCVTQVPEIQRKQDWWVAILLLALPVAGWINSRFRYVRFENSKLQIGPWGKTYSLGSRVSVERHNRFFIWPVVTVRFDEVEIQWPNWRNATSDIEQALQALAVLRRSVVDQEALPKAAEENASSSL